MDLNRALARAKRIEEKLRERAFLPVGEEINGVDVKQFTLRKLTILFQFRSPFLYGGIREIEDVGQFLWIVSPHYSTEAQEIPLPWWRRRWARWRGHRIPTVREAYMAQVVMHPNWHLFYRAIDRYIERAFMDTPPSSSGGKSIGACYAAAMIHRIACTYHWEMDKILDTPVAALFQLLKWIEVMHNPNVPQFNPLQDRIKARLMK